MSKKQRLAGLDVLKIISAIMIVMLHYLGYSDNLLIKSAQSRELFIAANLLEAFCICGVNVFVIISCYISIKANKTSIKSGISRAVSVWVQTICITIPLAAILLVTGIAKFSFGDILHMHPMLKTIYGSEEISRLYPTTLFSFVACCVAIALVVFLGGVLIHQVLKKPAQKISNYLKDRLWRVIKRAG